MGACPKCGRATEPRARVCGACGVIISKVRVRAGGQTADPGPVRPGPALSPAPRTRALPPPPGARPPVTPPTSPSSSSHALVKVGLATVAAIAAVFGVQRLQNESASPPGPPIPPAGPVMAEALPPPESPTSGISTSLAQSDIDFLDGLFARISADGAAAPSGDELTRVERLLAAQPDNAQLKGFLVGLYFRSAARDLRQRAFPQFEQTLTKLKFIADQPQIYAMEAQGHGDQGDWAGAEQSLLAYERAGGDESLTMAVNLAISIQSQGRLSEALGILDRPIFGSCAEAATTPDVNACRIAGRIRTAATASDEPIAPLPEERPRADLRVDVSKSQIQSNRFDVRFDGENQSGVARDVLFVLDRAYVRLRDIYYEEPSRKIPVVLHSSRDYFTKTGAPWWSGGVYSSHDGAIQIPIRGLPRDLPKEMEDVLVHELSHAFVDEMSGGWAGRDLQEGLAQYMEGRRIEDELGLAELKRLANTRTQSVTNFYMLSLATTQQMVQSRGQGVVNQLLKAMKEAGSEDAGYQKAFGRTRAEMKKEILDTFWRRYS